MNRFWMAIVALSCLSLFACNLQHPTETDNESAKKIIAYIFPSTDTIDTAKIRLSQLTHINYAFAKISKGKIASGDISDTINLKQIKLDISNNKSACKLIISVGGWEFSDQFSDIALSKSSRSQFIQSVTAYLKFFDLDGVDIDWEYPGKAGKTNNFRVEDKTNYTLLLKEMRFAFDSVEAIEHKHYITSVAIPAFPEFYNNIESEEFSQYLDYINLMAYDFYGEWEPVSGHQSNLYASNNPKSISVDSSVRLLIHYKIPPSKIIVGIPFYSRSWKITERKGNEYIHNLGQGAGINSVYEDLRKNFINKKGYKEYWDNISGVPYLWNDSLKIFVTYENPESIGLKCNYILNNQLGGAMFWKYNLNDENQLLNVIYSELHNQ